MAEKKANEQRFLEPDRAHFVKCSECFIYTKVDVRCIEAHKASQHHLRKQSISSTHNDEETGTSSSTFRPVPARLPLQDFEKMSAYPRFIPLAAAAAATEASASEVAAGRTAAATAAAASAVRNAAAKPEEADEEKPTAAEQEEAANKSASCSFAEDDFNQEWRFDENGKLV